MFETYGPSLVGLVLIVSVHLQVGRMHFLERRDGVWLDFLAGIAAGYVFVDILPHLADKQVKFAKLGDEGMHGFLHLHIYVLALIGFLAFLGVFLAGQRGRLQIGTTVASFADSPLPIKVELVSLALYTGLIGYMLAEQPTHRAEPSLVFASAMAAHYVGLDHLVRHHYPKLYDGTERYLLVALLVLGWLLGVFIEFSGLLYAAVFAFLAGGIIVMTAIYELPRITSKRRYWSFCSGAAVFTLAIMALESVRMVD